MVEEVAQPTVSRFKGAHMKLETTTIEGTPQEIVEYLLLAERHSRPDEQFNAAISQVLAMVNNHAKGVFQNAL
jgi:C4-type Zn-finger protein